jgi:hypothetical protein
MRQRFQLYFIFALWLCFESLCALVFYISLILLFRGVIYCIYVVKLPQFAVAVLQSHNLILPLMK